jgi:hypothetical protein
MFHAAMRVVPLHYRDLSVVTEWDPAPLMADLSPD